MQPSNIAKVPLPLRRPIVEFLCTDKLEEISFFFHRLHFSKRPLLEVDNNTPKIELRQNNPLSYFQQQ
jgi:hypothetical protein